MDRRGVPAPSNRTANDYEEYLQKLNAQRRKSSVGGSSVNPSEDGVEWNPAEKEWSEEFIRKASERIEQQRRKSRGFDNFNN